MFSGNERLRNKGKRLGAIRAGTAFNASLSVCLLNRFLIKCVSTNESNTSMGVGFYVN